MQLIQISLWGTLGAALAELLEGVLLMQSLWLLVVALLVPVLVTGVYLLQMSSCCRSSRDRYVQHVVRVLPLAIPAPALGHKRYCVAAHRTSVQRDLCKCGIPRAVHWAQDDI